MTDKPNKPFSPPTVDQINKHLARYAPRISRMWINQLPLILLILAAVLTLIAGNVLTAILPWMLLIGVLIYTRLRVVRTRNIQRDVQQVHDWTQLGEHVQATRAIWRLLMITQLMPEVHGRLVALMALNLDKLTAYASAEVTYDYLIQRMPTDHPGSVQLQLQRTILQLFNDELSTADTNLRKLRPIAMEHPDTPICAMYAYGSLLQQIQTFHYADAVAENKDKLVAQLRPLGIEAGHGYGLMAWSYYQLSLRSPDDLSLMEQAKNWWRKANLLLSSKVLIQRQPDLKQLVANLAYTPETPQAAPEAPNPQEAQQVPTAPKVFPAEPTTAQMSVELSETEPLKSPPIKPVEITAPQIAPLYIAPKATEKTEAPRSLLDLEIDQIQDTVELQSKIDADENSENQPSEMEEK